MHKIKLYEQLLLGTTLKKQVKHHCADCAKKNLKQDMSSVCAQNFSRKNIKKDMIKLHCVSIGSYAKTWMEHRQLVWACSTCNDRNWEYDTEVGLHHLYKQQTEAQPTRHYTHQRRDQWVDTNRHICSIWLEHFEHWRWKDWKVLRPYL